MEETLRRLVDWLTESGQVILAGSAVAVTLRVEIQPLGHCDDEEDGPSPAVNGFAK